MTMLPSDANAPFVVDGVMATIPPLHSAAGDTAEAGSSDPHEADDAALDNQDAKPVGTVDER